jgi:hypothetical protein
MQPGKYNGIQGSYGPQPKFRTAWGDPNSAANNGGLIGLVTGGAISRPRKDKDEEKRQKDQKKRDKNRRKNGNYSDSGDDDYDDQRQNRQGVIGTLRGSVMDRSGQDRNSGIIGTLRGSVMDRSSQHRDSGYIRTVRGSVSGRLDQDRESVGGIKALKSKVAPNSDLLYLMIINKP